jgi:hypothetical protein
MAQLVRYDGVHFALAEALQQVVGQQDHAGLHVGKGVGLAAAGHGQDENLVQLHAGLSRQGEDAVAQLADRERLRLQAPGAIPLAHRHD